MDDRREDLRFRARIHCDLMIAATGERYSDITRNISRGGAEFETSESMTGVPGRRPSARQPS
ncbi:MAG: hypothetical protein WAS49_03100 [Candidatus Dechloromonas phosphoritropha]|jgi:hypothetical protein|nr:PilZ domain-containing protein [Candidatus Dechloromonas phosphoritropha]MBP6707574.1 PilZ domain-containing protein [Accumulibacter sp.]MBP8786377.1 PilZ domain-containing protein [Azonexus sp.]MBP9228030.1 PilZ domain-containing protein [Azonexus sp.]